MPQTAAAELTNLSHFSHQSLTLSNPVQSKPASTQNSASVRKSLLSFQAFFKYILTTASAHKHNQKQAVFCSMETRTLHPTYAKQWRH